MPNRIIKESICTSPNLDKLSPQAETLFYRLIVNCDDYGRFEDDDKIIRSRCFPRKIDNITDKAIRQWLIEIQQAQLVKLYSVDGRRFLQFSTWENHQQIRAKRSRYPSPNGKDNNGLQLIADDSICPRNPIQSESNPNPNTIYNFWNEQKIIIHKKLTDSMIKAIYKSLKDYEQNEILQSIKNYAEILHSESYFFKYKWNLDEFLNRGLSKFLDLDVAKNNYTRGNKDGTHQSRPGKTPTKYTRPEELLQQ
ncbi:MAG: hypothetical protein PHQ86_04760 [Dehalococcoidales bacterium]|jgi:hypothetical protein|nr:hypothetical protein [Dehalococcoidales bacterium]